MTFITKDSGVRQEFEGGFVRDSDEGKINFDLLMPKGQPLDETLLGRVAALMTRGAKKYTPRNWENACSQEALDRARESAVRHFFQWWAGDRDEDHLAAVVFNLNMVCYLEHKLDLLDEEAGMPLVEDMWDSEPCFDNVGVIKPTYWEGYLESVSRTNND